MRRVLPFLMRSWHDRCYADHTMNAPRDSEHSANSTGSWIVVMLLLTAATVCGFLLDKYVSLTSLVMIYPIFLS